MDDYTKTGHSGEAEFDAIIVGSGTAGATIARELARGGKRVLIIERGRTVPLRETLGGVLAVANQVKLGAGRLSTVRALTTGGTTALYFGILGHPDLAAFRSLGIDLAFDVEQARRELPVGQVPDEALTPQARRLFEGAAALGHSWRKYDMLIDTTQCADGYNYAARWKARSYVEDAVRDGAQLLTRATVVRVLVEGGVASGVEYRLQTGRWRSAIQRAYGRRIILAAGETATPGILRASGVPGIGDQGFFCNPGYAIYGLVPGMEGVDGFVGSSGCEWEDGIELGDASLPRRLHAPMMLGGPYLRHLFAFRRTLGIGVKVPDASGGAMGPDGRFHKDFRPQEIALLKKGRQEAVRILAAAGAQRIVDFGITAAGRVGGLVRIKEHVDERLETSFRHLHVCDGSVIPEASRCPPTFTLVCLGRYLSRHLLTVL